MNSKRISINSKMKLRILLKKERLMKERRWHKIRKRCLAKIWKNLRKKNKTEILGI
jgi:hypothetical protein